jgi:hypothetical protein
MVEGFKYSWSFPNMEKIQVTRFISQHSLRQNHATLKNEK